LVHHHGNNRRRTTIVHAVGIRIALFRGKGRFRFVVGTTTVVVLAAGIGIALWLFFAVDFVTEDFALSDYSKATTVVVSTSLATFASLAAVADAKTTTVVASLTTLSSFATKTTAVVSTTLAAFASKETGDDRGSSTTVGLAVKTGIALWTHPIIVTSSDDRGPFRASGRDRSLMCGGGTFLWA